MAELKLKDGSNAGKLTAFSLRPEDVVLIRTPGHPLYDPRVEDAPDEAMVLNVMEYGVLEPILVRAGDAGPEVIDGRGRVNAALEANRRLAAAGMLPHKIPAVAKHGETKKMIGIMVSANERRRAPNPLERARFAQSLRDHGMTDAEIADLYDVAEQTVANWSKLTEVSAHVQGAVESGAINATVAYVVHELAPEKQDAVLARLMGSGRKITANAARDAVAEEQGREKPRMKTRAEIETVYNDLGIADCGNEYIDGQRHALRWVLGLRMPTPDAPTEEEG